MFLKGTKCTHETKPLYCLGRNVLGVDDYLIGKKLEIISSGFFEKAFGKRRRDLVK